MFSLSVFQSLAYTVNVKYNSSILKHRIDFPKEVIRKESLFTNIIVDETTSRPENHCDDAVIYISDTVEPGNYRQYFVLLLMRAAFNYKRLLKDDFITITDWDLSWS